jgi:glycosyltransferase involved in cell wall biosynthesis
MPRILHLLPAAPNFQTRRTLDLLARHLGVGFDIHIQTIGPRGHFRNIPAAILALRRRHDIDVLHTWGQLPLAAALLGSSAPILHSPALPLTDGSIHWLRAIAACRRIDLLCPTATIRNLLLTRGLPAGQTHLIRPAVDFARISRRRDPGLRAALGLSADDYILLAAGESTAAAAHEDAVWAAAILRQLDPRYKLLLWGAGPRAHAVARFNRRLATASLLVIAEQRLRRQVDFEDLLPAADMIINTSVGAIPTLPLAIAMAAALPIVSTATYTTSELLEDHHTALLVPRHAPRRLAQRILELREDPWLQWRLADMARTEAYEYFSLTRLLSQYRAAYHQAAAAQSLDIPESAPGPGLRFHGRAAAGSQK